MDGTLEQARAPVVVLYERATSWMVASLTGDLDPTRVVVDGDRGLLDVVQKAFPAAEVRPQQRLADRDWAQLVVVRGSERANARSIWRVGR